MASATNIGRATTAARGAGRTMKQAGDIGRAKENVAAIDQQVAALEGELQAGNPAHALRILGRV